jgi:gliding motility-associated-like protein
MRFLIVCIYLLSSCFFKITRFSGFKPFVRSKRCLSIGIILFCIFNLNGQCIENKLMNGSFDSAEGEAVTAPGWVSIVPSSGNLNTPDVNDETGLLNTTPGYVWTSTPLGSSDGGTWQNIFDSESVEQTLYVIAGMSYTLQFEYAAQGIGVLGFNYELPVGVSIYINDLLMEVTPADTTQYTWENYTFTFEAPTNMVTVKFSASGESYVGIDGICLVGTTKNQSVLKMPNVFTPNNDGINDSFYPQEMVNIGNAHLIIMNRWGELVFETDNLLIGWNGKINGENCSDGTYFWIVNYKNGYDNKEQSLSGFVQKI